MRWAVMIDIQKETDCRGIPIMNVGVSGYKIPITINSQHSTALAKLSVSLDSSQKGIHMSRLCSILEDIDSINNELFFAILENAAESMSSSTAELIIDTSFYLEKTAPVSRLSSRVYYDIKITGTYDNAKTTIFHKLFVPITSLCPCSKAISIYGAHNQRGILSVEFGQIDTNDYELIIRSLEKAAASSEIYEVLKRPDEKSVTERAYDNPKFVEDVVRDAIITCRESLPGKLHYVEATSFESIHSHNAFAATRLL